MARPRKNDHSKQELIEIGTNMLINQGYHGTGIKQILDVAGVPKGSFYNFFPSKEAFVATIIEQYGESTSSEFLKVLQALADKPALIQLWLGFHRKVAHKVDLNESCACLFGAMSSEIAQASTPCKQAIKNAIEQWASNLTKLLIRAQDEGDIHAHLSPQITAQLLHDLWQGSLLHYQVNDNPVQLLEQLHRFLCLLSTPQGQANLARYPTHLNTAQ